MAKPFEIEGKALDIPLVNTQYRSDLIRLSDIHLLGLDYRQTESGHSVFLKGKGPDHSPRHNQLAIGRSLLRLEENPENKKLELVSALQLIELAGGRVQRSPELYRVSYGHRSQVRYLTKEEMAARTWLEEQMQSLRNSGDKYVTIGSAEVVAVNRREKWLKVRTGNRASLATSNSAGGWGTSAIVNETKVYCKGAQIYPPELFEKTEVGDKVQLVLKPYKSRITGTEKGGLVNINTGNTRAIILTKPK